jgi:hypothetical protein
MELVEVDLWIKILVRVGQLEDKGRDQGILIPICTFCHDDRKMMQRILYGFPFVRDEIW